MLTDNGSRYRSKVFNTTLGPGIKHKYTRLYRPQTNGKAERFNRTMVEEWAYGMAYRSETERTLAFQAWLHITITNDATPHSRVRRRQPRHRPPWVIQLVVQRSLDNYATSDHVHQ